jgi:hypothetical protein
VRKIPTVYLRGEINRSKVTGEINPECRWVVDGEGVPTRKYDGTCVRCDVDGRWWARREVKPGKNPPQNYQAEQRDPITGKTVGWEPINQSPFVKMHHEAVRASDDWQPGTYELCGPKIQGNPERLPGHVLIRHATAEIFISEGPGDPASIVRIAATRGWEGIVWHHPDGRMAKLKARDLQ